MRLSGWNEIDEGDSLAKNAIFFCSTANRCSLSSSGRFGKMAAFLENRARAGGN